MTGNYNYRSYAPWGVWGTFRPTAITGEDATLGTVTQSAGYTTGFVGKWHLGGDFYKKNSTQLYRGDDRGDTPLDVDMTKWIANGPQDFGFDYDYTLPTGVQGPVYLAFENGLWAPLNRNSKLIHYDKNSAKDPFFVSDKGPGTGDSEWDSYKINEILSDRAEAFIKRSAQSKKPFFLYYCTPAVHIPHTPPKKLDGRKIRDTTPTHHTDMNRVVDWEVKKIVDALKESGTYENTLIIVTADNGGLSDPEAAKSGHLSNGGVRGTKNHPWEGGHLVPLIVSWPGVVQPNSRSDVLINGTDILATLAELVGTKLNEEQAKDSHSFYPLLRGKQDFQPRNEIMQQAGAQCELMFRQGNWKLLMQSDYKLSKMEPFALFNLADNPNEDEACNLIKEPKYANLVEALYTRYKTVRNSPSRTARIP
jgi:arylsulfatase A-like enzyme